MGVRNDSIFGDVKEQNFGSRSQGQRCKEQRRVMIGLDEGV
jgi:hypothetical protein